VGGVVLSVAGATALARSNAGRSWKAAQQSSGQIASTLALAIQHEQDLVAAATSFVLTVPHASEADLVQWAATVQAFQRYPELQGLGHSVIVPAAQLPAFSAQVSRDASGGSGSGGALQVVPPGPRPTYCLDVVVIARSAAFASPPGLDYCVASPGLLATRDTGEAVYQPLYIGSHDAGLGISVPIYRGGVTPATVAARRSAFLGWVGVGVTPELVLARALQGHPDTAVTFAYRSGSSDVSFRAGSAPRGARSVSTDLQNGWTVTTAAAVADGGVFANADSGGFLILGLALSVLLGVLVFVLGTGRERARRLVALRTEELHHLALHDALTGLPNRALIMDRLGQLLARTRRDGTAMSAMFVDLDDFKNVNDTLGHHAGDQLLVAVTARFAATLREADTIGRMGGDEFIVLLDGTQPDGPELVAQRLLAAMAAPFTLDDCPPMQVGISVGIATGDRAEAGDLLRDADVALYQAKAAGKNQYAVFDPHLHTAQTRRTDLEFDLRSALTGDQYRLVYQPIYDLGDLSIVGVEALLRWHHPTRGPIAPDEFIPLLERSGAIRAVGRWVLAQACEQMAAWHARGDTLDVSVNVSARQLDHDSVITDITDALQHSGLPASSLIIEVTETALMDNVEATAARLGAIKALGVRIAVDDFGTGYSSLAYLRQFPVDCLKIDRMFTHAITTSPESSALVATLVQLGRDLGLQTLAEGVETTEEMDLLRTAHVDHAQGFLMARPLDPHTLETQLLQPTRTAHNADTTDANT
jgi:diguanylate cyclase (GGDEF)-like protein